MRVALSMSGVGFAVVVAAAVAVGVWCKLGLNWAGRVRVPGYSSPQRESHFHCLNPKIKTASPHHQDLPIVRLEDLDRSRPNYKKGNGTVVAVVVAAALASLT